MAIADVDRLTDELLGIICGNLKDAKTDLRDGMAVIEFDTRYLRHDRIVGPHRRYSPGRDKSPCERNQPVPPPAR